MRLVKIILKNYRGYSEYTEIDISDITTIVGKNDAGKSTVLEALDTFFNESRAKFSIQDRNVHCEDDDCTVIGCVFSEMPNEIVIDEDCITSLQGEYLLDIDGRLTIIKEYNNVGKMTVYARANHPCNNGVSDLLSKKNTELKALVRQRALENVCNLNSNVSMRRALWSSFGDELDLQDKNVNLSKESGKEIWDKLHQYLPKYALFKSDRGSTDEDSEAQDPIQLAVAQALFEQSEQLNQIKQRVVAEVERVANSTIDKLREFDENLASSLSPKFKKEPVWDKAFSFSLTGDEDIPINKRGSGVRRLILFSFFRATIESDLCNNIIYAVEEPETSQHPNFQRIIVQTFQQMISNDNCQIIITTHTPGFAGMLPTDSLRYVTKENNITIVKTVNHDNATLLQQICDTLGVYPMLSQEVNQNAVKVVICVEGPNDISYLTILSRILHASDDSIPDLGNDSRVILIPLGGGTLQQWTNFNYLRNLGIKEFHIYDYDDDGHYQQYCDTVNSRGDGSSARLTRKRETENYLHNDLINSVFGIDIIMDDRMDVPGTISSILKSRHEENSSQSKVKNKLNNEVVSLMTKELLDETDTEGEIVGWFRTIKQLLD